VPDSQLRQGIFFCSAVRVSIFGMLIRGLALQPAISSRSPAALRELSLVAGCLWRPIPRAIACVAKLMSMTWAG